MPKNYAKGDLVKQRAYIDSICFPAKGKMELSWVVLLRKCQKKEINLGLDLKGGMNVILEVSVEDILKALSNYSTDKTFTEALARARMNIRSRVSRIFLHCSAELSRKSIRMPNLLQFSELLT